LNCPDLGPPGLKTTHPAASQLPSAAGNSKRKITIVQLRVEPNSSGVTPSSIPDGGQASFRLVTPQLKPPTLESQIELILGNTEYLPILQAVRRIFNDLVRLLDCLRLMEPNIHQVGETLALLELVQSDTIALLDFTENQALQTEGISERLYEVLDGMSFALRHEVRRVFEDDLRELSNDESSEITQAKIADAHRILTNCLQQSIITLAQVFDPRLDGRQLFDNSKARLKQSLLLCKDLWMMINLVRRAERSFDPDLISQVVDSVKAFRNGTMHYLMYRDWGHFERVVEDLSGSLGGELDSGPVLHQFLCYLETLLGQVKLRGVLGEMVPDFFSNQIGNKEIELDWTIDELRLAYELYMAG
jgi:hypothetical protein